MTLHPSTILVLPLRLPVKLDLDVVSPIAAWLEYQQDNAALNNNNNNNSTEEDSLLPLFISECYDDLMRLQTVRHDMAVALQESCHCYATCYEQAGPRMQQYAAAVAEFLQHESFWLPNSNNSRNSPDEIQKNDENDSHDSNNEPCWNPWKSHWKTQGCSFEDIHNEMDICSGLEWERANVVWNLCTLTLHQATRQDVTQKAGWVQTGAYLCTAAALLRQLRTEELYPEQSTTSTSSTLTANRLQVWEYAITAQAQYASYEAFRKLPRPRHFMLAKLAAAAIPLFQQVHDNIIDNDNDDDSILQQRYHEWSSWSLAWKWWMTALAHYHQAMEHVEKQQQQQINVLARFNAAMAAVETCQRIVQTQNWDIPVQSVVLDIQRHRQEVVEDEDENGGGDGGDEQQRRMMLMMIMSQDELPEIPTQSSINMTPDLSQVLPLLQDHFFQNLLSPQTRQHVQQFRIDMEQWVFSTATAGDEYTERARKTLAAVHLPHSLTAYRQEMTGGGVPDDLWERVHVMQKERRESHLKSHLWELQDQSDQAQQLLKRVSQQLEDDVEMDRTFLQSYPDFTGSDADEMQRPFRIQMQRFQRLMNEAEQSDALVQQKSESVDTDPKFRLLRLSKSQLDRLFPASSSTTLNSGYQNSHVTALSQHLVDLSMLFRDRETMIQLLRDEIKTCDIVPQLQELEKQHLHGDDEYTKVVSETKSLFQNRFHAMDDSMKQQDKLLTLILKENELFMNSRDKGSETFIVKLEDTLEEIDHLTEHLKEGKAFYDTILPKLQKWKLAVEDMSARLAIDRFDFEDTTRRHRQEAEDARMAASFGHSNGTETTSRAMATHPGVQSVSIHGRSSEIQVDDEKVASLVAMDFDPDAIVAALRKYNNDVDRALNDLLGG